MFLTEALSTIISQYMQNMQKSLFMWLTEAFNPIIIHGCKMLHMITETI